VEIGGVRPEQYLKETRLVETLPDGVDAEGVLSHIKAACESGWDFSSRWFVPQTGSRLEDTKTADIIPVDLNAFLYGNAMLLQEFCGSLEGVCDHTVEHYAGIASNFKTGIKDLLWSEFRRSWFDYNYVRDESNQEFYASNLIPLWTRADHRDTDPFLITKVLGYLEGSRALTYPAGLPTSLLPPRESCEGEQWDLPNGWAPLVHMVVEALDSSQHLEAIRVAQDLARKWTQTNYLAWTQYKDEGGGMFEKYDVTRVGCPGCGGMYATVLGFGWTNGVILDFLTRYYYEVAPPIPVDGINCTIGGAF